MDLKLFVRERRLLSPPQKTFLTRPFLRANSCRTSKTHFVYGQTLGRSEMSSLKSPQIHRQTANAEGQKQKEHFAASSKTTGDRLDVVVDIREVINRVTSGGFWSAKLTLQNFDRIRPLTLESFPKRRTRRTFRSSKLCPQLQCRNTSVWGHISS